MVSNADLTLKAFTILREHFFDQNSVPKTFPLREKRNTHDNPRKAIERSFPFVEISEIAERQSWRKDVYQPVYYIHKWWARRLSTVFRAIVIGACAPAEGAAAIGSDGILDLFYRPGRFPGTLIYDPFMGSGTTVGEAYKLGCRVIGRDINPVSYFMVSLPDTFRRA